MQVDNFLSSPDSIHSSLTSSNSLSRFLEKFDTICCIRIIAQVAFELLDIVRVIYEGWDKKRIKVLDKKDQSITHYMVSREDTVDALKVQISEKMGLTFNEIELKHNGIELENDDIFSQMISSVELTRRVKISPKNSLESFYVSEEELKEKTKQQLDESILHCTLTTGYPDTSNLDPNVIEWYKGPLVYHLQLTKKIPIFVRFCKENLVQKHFVLSEDKVGTLIKKIKQERNTENSIALIYGKQILKSNKTFADYKITAESPIFLLQRKVDQPAY